MSVEVVDRKEFEQAMEALGLVKICTTCLKKYRIGSCSWECMSYDYDEPLYKWERLEEVK